MKKRSKKIKRLVALLLVMALTIWVASRWNVWFGNPEELAVEPLMTPGHVMLTFGNEDEMSRNVSWQCDTVLQSSWLELVCDSDSVGIEAQGEVFASRKGKAAYYVARLRDLKPDMLYRYRAVVGPRLGVAESFSPWYTFRTYAAGRDRFYSLAKVLSSSPFIRTNSKPG